LLRYFLVRIFLFKGEMKRKTCFLFAFHPTFRNFADISEK